MRIALARAFCFASALVVAGLHAPPTHAATPLAPVAQIYISPFNTYGPYRIAVDSSRHRAYAVQSYPNRLWVLDTASNQQVYSLATNGLLPSAVAVNPQTGLAYITNMGSSILSVLDQASGSWLPSIQLGAPSEGIAIQASRNRAYVTTYDKTVLVVDLSSGSVVKTMRDGSFKTTNDVVVDPRRPRAYVQNEGANAISVVNTLTNRVIATIDTGHASNAIALDAIARRLYVGNDDGTLSVVDTANDANTIVATIAVGSGIGGVAVNPSLHRAYSTNFLDNTVSEVDTSTNLVLGSVAVGSDPTGIAIDSAYNREFVAGYYANYVTVLGE